MGVETNIEWCDHTFNPWIGCAKIAAGCLHCYAEADMDRRRGRVTWGPQGTRSRTSPQYWRQPVKWNRETSERGSFGSYEQPRVFCASLADVFEDWQGPIVNAQGDKLFRGSDGRTAPLHEFAGVGVTELTMADLRRDLFELIDATPNLDWLLVTKRPENIRSMWPAVACSTRQQAADRNERGELYRPNVWLLTSVATQADADRNVPELLKCRDLAPVLGISAEPLVGPIDLQLNGIDWVIAGGESGPTPRPMHPAWARGLRDQCAAAGVPFLFKQWGGWQPLAEVDRAGTHVTARIAVDGREVDPLRGERRDSDVVMARVGKRAAGRLLDGELCHEFPRARRGGVTGDW